MYKTVKFNPSTLKHFVKINESHLVYNMFEVYVNVLQIPIQHKKFT